MSDTDKQDWLLSPELEPLWDKLNDPAPARRGLTLGAIVETAVDLADAEGIDAVSMAKIAKHLGFATMALYRHVPSKGALIVLMIDRAVGRPPDMADAEGTWRGNLVQIALAQTLIYRHHPWLLAIPVSSPPATPNNLRWMNAMLVALRGTPLSPTEKVQILVMLISFVRGYFQLQTGQRDNDASDTAFLAVVTRLAEGNEFTELRNVLFADEQGSQASDEEEFQFGLDRVLDGVAMLIDLRDVTQQPPG